MVFLIFDCSLLFCIISDKFHEQAKLLKNISHVNLFLEFEVVLFQYSLLLSLYTAEAPAECGVNFAIGGEHMATIPRNVVLLLLCAAAFVCLISLLFIISVEALVF